MPIYEYACLKCGRRFTWLVGVVADSEPPRCTACGATSIERRTASRFARLRGQGEGDPLRSFANEVGEAAGESLGDEFDEYIDDVDSGD